MWLPESLEYSSRSLGIGLLFKPKSLVFLSTNAPSTRARLFFKMFILPRRIHIASLSPLLRCAVKSDINSSANECSFPLLSINKDKCHGTPLLFPITA